MNKIVVIEHHYLPLVSYFNLLKNSEKVLWEVSEHYQKQTLRNRTYILSANGMLILTVPIQHSFKKNAEVEIDYTQNWVKNHLRGIASAYRHSPYFEFYFPYLEEIYNSKPKTLLELNTRLTYLIIRFLKLDLVNEITTRYLETYPKGYTDLRSKYQYRDENVQSKNYKQVFGESFVSNLSVIDLIFNCGPDSKENL
ncbi:MAG TPA: hypothetical protein DCR46_02785 [Cytophagales bacterium]|nr:hypothetical protein [Cytophagales bacterium]